MNNNKQTNINRISVVYKGNPLMPCTKGRAGYLVKQKKAVFVYDKHLGWYLKLKVPPKSYYKQKLALGIDTGTMFAGFSVVNKNNSHNYEFEFTRKIQDRNCIKTNSASRSSNRRCKRSRLRHRETRFLNRTGNKVTATENYYYENFRNMTYWITKLFPITDIAIEDIKSIHNKDNPGNSFSPLEQIKTRLYNKLRTYATIHITRGIHKWRLEENDRDPKIKEIWRKGELSFYTHCIDSHALCRSIFNNINIPYNTEFTYISRRLPNIDKIRRKLIKFQAKQGCKYRSLSKLKKIRTKVNNNRSNHGTWIYMYTIPERTCSHIIRLYGGSIYHATKYGHNYGDNKYKTNLGYQYYELQFIKTS